MLNTTSAPTRNAGRNPGISTSSRVVPSPVSEPHFSWQQELEPFGTWTSQPLWVPPKNASRELAATMLDRCGLFASSDQRWEQVVQVHRGKFTQVRQIELSKASIRLPKDRLYVSVMEREQFGEITDPIPKCVQTRLDEFLAGPGRKRGVKVYYLKPLCVEVGEQLIFTGLADITSAVEVIQQEVFAHYRRDFLAHRSKKWLSQGVDASLAVPRRAFKYVAERRKRALDAYQAQLEFKRRKTAFRAARLHRRLRTDGCSFDDMLSLTNPLIREDVVEQYAVEHQLSRAERMRLLKAASATLPWFVTLSLGVSYLSSITVTVAPPLMVCDPAFVAEMPGRPGELLKIGHFDEVNGVTHVEI